MLEHEGLCICAKCLIAFIIFLGTSTALFVWFMHLFVCCVSCIGRLVANWSGCWGPVAWVEWKTQKAAAAGTLVAHHSTRAPARAKKIRANKQIEKEWIRSTWDLVWVLVTSVSFDWVTARLDNFGTISWNFKRICARDGYLGNFPHPAPTNTGSPYSCAER